MTTSTPKKSHKGVIHVTKQTGYELESKLSPVALKSSGTGFERDVYRSLQLAADTLSGSDRLPFEHDRDRIIHSRQFRKLAGKTQLLIRPNRGDIRTRLTHTMEVYQLATHFARRFNLNVPAVEAIALAHDTGHTPFGHAGEAALNEILHDCGGFHHAAHSVRTLDRAAYDFHIYEKEQTPGLNLTWAVREGIFKHGWYSGPTTPYHKQPPNNFEWDLDSYRTYGSVEAQVVTLADQIAYLNHDLADLTVYGFEKILSSQTIEVFFAKHKSLGDPDWNNTIQDFLTLLTADESSRAKLFVRDAVDASAPRIKDVAQGDADLNAQRLIEFSPARRRVRNLFYSFFVECVYSDVRIRKKNENARSCVRFLHDFFTDLFAGNLELLPIHVQDELKTNPPWWQSYLSKLPTATIPTATTISISSPLDNSTIACKLAAADVVADMTDSEALTSEAALKAAESTSGTEALDRILATFPNHDQYNINETRRNNRGNQIRSLFQLARK